MKADNLIYCIVMHAMPHYPRYEQYIVGQGEDDLLQVPQYVGHYPQSNPLTKSGNSLGDLMPLICPYRK